MWLILILIVAAYLIGSIPFGLLVGLAKGVDIRKSGSGNIGATNAGRVLGKTYGIAVFLLDVLKGLLPTLIFGFYVQGAWTAEPPVTGAAIFLWWIAAAGACICGHVFPIYLGFRGGKGVATSLGVLLGFYPLLTWPGLIAFGVWIALTGITRYVSVGSVGAAAAFPIIFAVMVRLTGPADRGFDFDRLWPLYAFSLAMAGLVIFRHRGNLKRLMAGTESKIGSTSKPAAS